MSGLVTFLFVLYILFCVGLIALILVQKKRTNGLSGLTGGSSSLGSDTYWDKNKSRTLEGKLELYTKVGIGFLFVITFIISMF